MVSIKSLVERIYSSPEKQVYEWIINHAKKCQNTSHRFYNLFEDLVAGKKIDVETELENIMKLEEEADHIRRKILERLAVIGIPPSIRQDYVRITEKIDGIADWIKAAARIVKVMGDIDKLDKSYLEALRNMSKISYEASKLLVDALEKSKENYRDALNIIKEIELKEDEGDNLYINTLALSRRYQDFLLFKLVDNIENSIDATEDASDILEEIIVRIIR